MFSVVYCRVFLSLSCIVVYYPINFRVCTNIFVYWNTRYTIHDTRRFRVLKVKLYYLWLRPKYRTDRTSSAVFWLRIYSEFTQYLSIYDTCRVNTIFFIFVKLSVLFKYSCSYFTRWNKILSLKYPKIINSNDFKIISYFKTILIVLLYTYSIIIKHFCYDSCSN